MWPSFHRATIITTHCRRYGIKLPSLNASRAPVELCWLVLDPLCLGYCKSKLRRFCSLLCSERSYKISNAMQYEARNDAGNRIAGSITWRHHVSEMHPESRRIHPSKIDTTPHCTCRIIPQCNPKICRKFRQRERPDGGEKHDRRRCGTRVANNQRGTRKPQAHLRYGAASAMKFLS